MADRIELRSDCSRCAALCCIAYPSDDMPGFAASKQAGEPCPKLDDCGSCTIYDERADRGFAGCIGFECFGAGQHVVQTLFGGKDWRDDPTLAQPMVATFLSMRPVSDLLYLVDHARTLGSIEQAELDVLEQRLLELSATREALADRAALAAIEQQVRQAYRTSRTPSA